MSDQLTLRERAAIAALQGVTAADLDYNMSAKRTAEWAIEIADELVRQLRGTETKGTESA